ncbi:MAG: hypothetical protein V4663_12395 [Bacteroidota bacterium]
MDFKSSLAALELDQSVIYKQELNTKSRPIVFSNPPAPNSPFQPVYKETEELPELRDWLNIGKTLSKTQPFYPDDEVFAMIQERKQLSKDQLKTVRHIIESYIIGKCRLTKKQIGTLEYAYSPFKLAVYAAEKLEVDDNPFVISGVGPVFVAIGELNMRKDSVIMILTNSNIITDKLTKYK